jgi:hypothetical protein
MNHYKEMQSLGIMGMQDKDQYEDELRSTTVPLAPEFFSRI